MFKQVCANLLYEIDTVSKRDRRAHKKTPTFLHPKQTQKLKILIYVSRGFNCVMLRKNKK